MKLKCFEITYSGGRRTMLKAKSWQTLDKRLGKETRENALIHQVKCK